MKSLIIHPKDPTTTFLKPVYADISNKTIIEGGANKNELKKLIESHDRVIMLGHGSSDGLFSVGQFTGNGSYIIDVSMVKSLRDKTNNIFIWCFADQFVRYNELNGFCTGMFISEIEEAWYYDFYYEEKLIDESNDEFARIVSRNINETLDVLNKNVIREYGLLAQSNPIARFNLDCIYCNESNNKWKVSKQRSSRLKSTPVLQQK